MSEMVSAHCSAPALRKHTGAGAWRHRRKGEEFSDWLNLGALGEELLRYPSPGSGRCFRFRCAQENLNGAQIAGRLVDDRNPHSTKQMWVEIVASQNDASHPFVLNASVLPVLMWSGSLNPPACSLIPGKPTLEVLRESYWFG